MTFKFVVKMWKLLLASLPTLNPCDVRIPTRGTKVSNENNEEHEICGLDKANPSVKAIDS